ncbi:MAG: selenide, water dikinase SelD [Chitinophagaceae bacterium]|nr:selenide, water dikinase SelD [Oligoflexus sp.]
MDKQPIRLTETVKKGGCAAKLPAGQLRKVLQNLSIPKPASLAVGTETMDDACLWDLGDGRYMIQTLDFFTPIVDDARSFGAIAAANALSDVYAMGGEPKVALTILAFPTAHLPLELLQPLMEGALERITAAGACLGGGHSIDDETLKLGFSVTGFVDKSEAWTNAGAKAGDALILTKALGTGTLMSALKSKKASSEWIDEAIQSMTQLNQVRDLIMGDKINAATDVTGFGLAGHCLQMCRASGVKATIRLSSLPVLAGAMECLNEEILNKAHYSNAAYVDDNVSYSEATASQRWLCVDPQTSGGLLLSVPQSSAQAVLEKIKARFAHAEIIGRIEAGEASIVFEG